MTSDVRRMSGVRFTPSTAQQDVRWAAAVSKKQAMLRNSDWTQLRDVHQLLTAEQRLAWDGWRRRVRSTKTQDFETPEAFESALQALSVRLPAAIVDANNDAPPLPEPTLQVEVVTDMLPALHEGTSINAEDAVWEVTRTALEVVSRKCRIMNRATFETQVSEATDICADNVMNHEADPLRYPVTSIIAEQRKMTLMEAAEDTLDKYRRWIVASSYIEGSALETLDKIEVTDQASEHNRQLIMDLDLRIQNHLHALETLDP